MALLQPADSKPVVNKDARINLNTLVKATMIVCSERKSFCLRRRQ